MAELKQRFPQDLDYTVALDTTRAVSEGMHEISDTLWQALLLVVLVVFVFLQGWRATLIPLLAVPVSLIGTFVFFPLFGFSVNTLSLFGLVLAIGLVVDDAIVVVEAVEHHIEEGLAPREATLKAMEEVAGPVVAIAIILAAVFVPTAFIPGITGRLYQQFAAHDRDFGHHLGLQRAVAQPGPVLAAPAPARSGRAGRWAAFTAGSTALFRRANEGYVGVSRHLIRKWGLSLLHPRRRFAVGGLALGSRLRPAFLPRGGPGVHLRGRCSCPTPPRSSGPRRRRRRWRRSCNNTPGVDNYTAVIGFSLLSRSTTPTAHSSSSP